MATCLPQVPGTLRVWKGTGWSRFTPADSWEGLSLQGCEATGRLSSHLRELAAQSQGAPPQAAFTNQPPSLRCCGSLSVAVDLLPQS